MIEYYVSNSCKKNELKGTIKLDDNSLDKNYKNKEDCVYAQVKYKFGFDIACQGRVWELRVSNEELRNEWIEDIKKCITGNPEYDITGRINNVYGDDGSIDETDEKLANNNNNINNNNTKLIHVTEEMKDQFNNTHICEIQLIHRKLWEFRSNGLFERIKQDDLQIENKADDTVGNVVDTHEQPQTGNEQDG